MSSFASSSFRPLIFFLVTLLPQLASAERAAFDRAHWNYTDGYPSETRRELTATAGLCFDRIDGSGQYLSLTPHPQGKGLAVLSSQAGLLSLVTLPAVNSKPGVVVFKNVWLDLTSRVLNSGERGFLSHAFHPNFLKNGRFFVSYICDANTTPDCKGPCACTTATGCRLGGGSGATCNGQTIVAEYSAGSNPSTATKLAVKEVRRLINFGRPYANHNGGHIFFGKDGYLYYTSGDGGFHGDPWNFAQRGNTFLGKILRLDVNSVSSMQAYGIPKDNPFLGVPGFLPEIYALGLRNPWRCAVDSLYGYIFCGDVGQNDVEEVDIILPGYNYGWHNFEGTTPYTAKGFTAYLPTSKLPGRKLMPPLFEYSHDCNIKGVPDCMGMGSASITGGVLYRGQGNQCLQGKYLYNDLISPVFWAGTVYPPKGQAPSTKRVPFACSPTSPIPCVGGLGVIKWGWGQDLGNNAYLLSDNGIYRVTAGSKCGYTC